MRKTVFALTIALTVSGCTIYIGGDDDDHEPTTDAGWWLEGDAGWWPEGDAGWWPEGDAGWYPDAGYEGTDAMPIGDAGVPEDDASCGTPP